MSDILLITPPDKIFNQNKSCLLIYPTETIRREAQAILADLTESYNVYVYAVSEEHEHDIEWLLTVSRYADITVIDIDNSDIKIKNLASYLVSLPRTYWLTGEDNSCYHMLSPNRIWGLDSIRNILGGSIEEQESQNL